MPFILHPVWQIVKRRSVFVMLQMDDGTLIAQLLTMRDARLYKKCAPQRLSCKLGCDFAHNGRAIGVIF